MAVAFDVHETSASDSHGSVQLIDLTEEEPEAPFAVREADGSLDAVPGRIPDKAEILAWLEDHPVVVGIATGVLCFSIIAGAMSTVLGDDNADDDPVAGAALSETDGSQGSFSSSGSGGANFTSDDSKLSRTGAGKDVDDLEGAETAAGANTNPNGPSARNSQQTGPGSESASDLDQSATIDNGGSTTGRLPGQPADPSVSTTRPSGTSSPTTLNPGPNVSGNIPTTATTAATTPSQPGTSPTNPTTVTTAGQTPSTPRPSTSTPTVPATSAPTTTPTTPSTAPPAELSIAAPGNGTSHSFETPTNFAANFVPGATEYCWSFTQNGTTALTACSNGTTYQLPARPSQLDPGLVTVKVTATGPFGTLADTIQISLYRTKVLNNPTQDLEIGRSPLRVGVVNLVGATSYCFTLTQSGYSSGELCYSTPGKTFNKNHEIWDSLSPGPLTVSARILGSGGVVLAVDSVTIQLL